MKLGNDSTTSVEPGIMGSAEGVGIYKTVDIEYRSFDIIYVY